MVSAMSRGDNPEGKAVWAAQYLHPKQRSVRDLIFLGSVVQALIAATMHFVSVTM